MAAVEWKMCRDLVPSVPMVFDEGLGTAFLDAHEVLNFHCVDPALLKGVPLMEERDGGERIVRVGQLLRAEPWAISGAMMTKPR